MYNFVEDIRVELPDITEQSMRLAESDGTSGVILEIAAIHEGVTANYTEYTKKALAESVDTWVTPYAKPVITNHNIYSEAIGRVMASKMGSDSGKPCLWIQVAVPDQSAIEKFKDNRFLTGSVGGRAKEAICSICNTDWAKPSESYPPCQHIRGREYDGQVCTIKLGGLDWKEYSMVNAPADPESGVRSIKDADGGEAEESTDDRWVKATAFTVDMNSESIFDLTGDEPRNILENEKPKKASVVYHTTMGAFLSAIADDKDLDMEIRMSENDSQEEDILAISDELSEAISKSSEEESADQDGTETDTENPEEGGQGSDEAGTEGDEPGEEDAEMGEEPEEEEGSDGDPAGEDSTEGDTETVDEVGDEGVNGDALAAAEERIATLEAEVEALRDRNDKLSAAIKRGMVERVVDAKILRGMEQESDRPGLIEEHMGRTASSLADTLIDLSKVKIVNPVESDVARARELYSVNSSAISENSNEQVTTTEGIDKEVDEGLTESDEASIVEDILVDGLMGRSKL